VVRASRSASRAGVSGRPRPSAVRISTIAAASVITLEAARTLPRVTRAAVYEPPFYADGIAGDDVRRLNAEIARGDLPAGLVTMLLVSGLAPAPLRVIPRPVARLLARIAFSVDDRVRSPYAKLRDLVPALRYDAHVVAGMDARMATFAAVTTPMLLLSGTKSPAFLRRSSRELAGVLPHARHIEFDGLGHDGSWNAGRGGRPTVVAAALREFFL
jgi:hypothetical protein